MKQFYFLLAFIAISMFTYGQKFTGLTATASTGTGAMAVDNNMGTRWESAFADPQWITVDLGEEKTVGAIKLYWEGANAKDYSISFSTNGTDFTGELNYTGKAGGSRNDVIDNLNVNCRYVKMNGTARNLTYGYSIWEFEVFPPVTPVLTSLDVTPSSSSIILGETIQLTVGGLDQLGNPIVLTNTTDWTVDGTGASIDVNGLLSSTQKGLFTVTATNSSFSKTATIDVLPTNANLSVALGITASALSGTAAAAFDNNKGTRWESAFTDPQWIMIDLGAKYDISDIIISWEAANAKDYIIETSINDIDWTTLATKIEMSVGTRTDRLYDLNTLAQYVRLTGTTRNLTYGYSIWEFQIYGTVSTSTSSPSLKGENLISVYPNPATDRINISGDIAEVTLHSIQGQLIYSVKNTNTINISSFSKGLYLVKVADKSGNQFLSKLEIR
jgi:hypothetical protein